MCFPRPSSFYWMVGTLLCQSFTAAKLHCCSLAPIVISKPWLIMQDKFGLVFEITETTAGINAAKSPPHFRLNICVADIGSVLSLEDILIEKQILLGARKQ